MAYLEYVNAAPDHQDLLATLAKANHFTMEELAQNRAGRIADSQMFKLALKAVRPVFLASRALLGWLLFLLVLRVFVPGFALRMASIWMGKSVLLLLLGITLACVASFVMGMLKSGKRVAMLFADLSKGKTASLEGRAWATRGEEQGEGMARLRGEKEGVYQYALKDHTFEVHDLLAYEALQAREIYRIYYAPASKLLLSIEPLMGTPLQSQSTTA